MLQTESRIARRDTQIPECRATWGRVHIVNAALFLELRSIPVGGLYGQRLHLRKRRQDNLPQPFGMSRWIPQRPHAAMPQGLPGGLLEHWLRYMFPAGVDSSYELHDVQAW